jgi:hypothetical protein
MNSKLAKQIQHLLRMLSHSIHGPWPTSPEQDYPDTRPQAPHPAKTTCTSESAPRASSVLPLFSSRTRTPRRPALSAIRMQCLRLLKSEESLTSNEAAKRLGLEPTLVHAQFCELLSLRLIEKAGARRVEGRLHPLFHLNPSHPLLELLLGSNPAGTRPAIPS